MEEERTAYLVERWHLSAADPFAMAYVPVWPSHGHELMDYLAEAAAGRPLGEGSFFDAVMRPLCEKAVVELRGRHATLSGKPYPPAPVTIGSLADLPAGLPADLPRIFALSDAPRAGERNAVARAANRDAVDSLLPIWSPSIVLKLFRREQLLHATRFWVHVDVEPFDS